MTLPFEERACFAAGQAKTGTTLLIALLDGHPQLLVLPEETAYFPTALNKYGKYGRRAQADTARTGELKRKTNYTQATAGYRSGGGLRLSTR